LTNDVWAFNPSLSQWQPLWDSAFSAPTEDVPVPRRDAALLHHSLLARLHSDDDDLTLLDFLYLYGGEDQNDRVLDDLWQMDLRSATWRQLWPLPFASSASSSSFSSADSSSASSKRSDAKGPVGREGVQLALAEDRYLLLFGGQGEGGVYLSDCWALDLLPLELPATSPFWELIDPDTILGKPEDALDSVASWEQVGYALPTHLAWYSAHVADQSVFLYGGVEEGALSASLFQLAVDFPGGRGDSSSSGGSGSTAPPALRPSWPLLVGLGASLAAGLLSLPF
jgi:hypothetical protein